VAALVFGEKAVFEPMNQRNCLILGSGRSGTSMVAGTLANAGYYMGDTMMAATEANPKGYFEAREVEAVNDKLIDSMLKPAAWERWLNRAPQQPNFEDGHSWAKTRWLALVPPHRKAHVRDKDLREIERLTSNSPYCFKDPRFSYTLPVWRPYLKNTVYICVFREPAVTAASILKEVEREEYLQGIKFTLEQALGMWTYSYRHILEKHRHQGDWLFLHYQQVLTPYGLDQIEAFTGAVVNRDFPDERLRRTSAEAQLPSVTARVYEQLCRLAGV
jgi:hypothetical protein